MGEKEEKREKREERFTLVHDMWDQEGGCFSPLPADGVEKSERENRR